MTVDFNGKKSNSDISEEIQKISVLWEKAN